LHALDAAALHAPDEGTISHLVQLLMDVGIDGAGPLKSAQWIAEDARRETRTTEAAISKIARKTVARGAIGGFVTSLGGFGTMPNAPPGHGARFCVQRTSE